MSIKVVTKLKYHINYCFPKETPIYINVKQIFRLGEKFVIFVYYAKNQENLNNKCTTCLKECTLTKIIVGCDEEHKYKNKYLVSGINDEKSGRFCSMECMETFMKDILTKEEIEEIKKIPE